MPTLDDVLMENQRLRGRVDDLEDLVRAHIGPNTGSGGADYPHPRQQVDVTEYGGGRMRLDPAGIQIVADDDNRQPAAFFIVPSFFFEEELSYSGGTPFPDRDFWSGINGNADDTNNYIELISRNYTGNLTTWFASVLAYADGSTALVELKAQSDAGTVAEAQLTAYATGLGTFFLTNAMLVLDSETSDPSANLFDGALLYRSDTDKFRARVNGAWVNLLTSADTVGNVSLAATEQSGSYAPSSGQVVVYTGTGGHTITLPDATEVGAESNKIIIVKHNGAGVLTIDGTSTQTIDDALTISLAPYDSVILYSSTGSWFIV